MIAISLTLLNFILQPHSWKQRHEIKVYKGTLDTTIGKPWCYRLLASWMAWGMVKVFRNFFLAFGLLRFIQNWIIIYLFNEYSFIFGTNNIKYLILAMVVGYIGTDFRLNTHNETILMLLSMIVLLTGNLWWLVPIGIVAAFNRETYGIFYVMALIMEVRIEIVCAFVCFLIILFLIRKYHTSDKLTCPQHTPGWGLVKKNLLNPLAWGLNLAAYSPVCMVGLNQISAAVITGCVVNWIINLWYGNMRETALYFNPYILLLPLL